MRFRHFLFLSVVVFPMGAQSRAQQQRSIVPALIRFNGHYQPSANIQERSVVATFTIYRDENSWTPLWTEIQSVEPDKDGDYSVLLGSTSVEGIPVDLFAGGEPRWLEVEINQVAQPRVALVSVPYALKAHDAETLGGLPASAFLRAPPAPANAPVIAKHVGNPPANLSLVAHSAVNSNSGSPNYIPVFADAANLVNSAIHQSGNTVSIGGHDSLGALTLIGNVVGGDTAGMALYNSGGGGGASISLDFYNTSANGGIPQAKIKGIDDGSFSDNLTFWTKLPGDRANPVSERMRITSSGNVGIGTTNPQQALEVNGNAVVDGNVIVTGSILNASAAGPVLQSANDNSFNVAAGIGALPSTTTGKRNTAAGFGALGGNTTGTDNTALGKTALAANTTGNLNTAVGSTALNANTTGFSNTVLGAQALSSNTAGWGNTAIGAQALLFNLSGNNNIAIGYGAGSLLFSGSNNIYLGQVPALQTESGAIRIGSSAGSNAQTATFIAGVRGITTAYPNAVPVFIDSNGQLGTMSSSRRFKEDIHDMGNVTEGLMRLRPVTFRYKKPFADGSKPIQYGLIAEEVEKVYPELVARSPDGQIETVKYQFLDSLLLNEVQRLHAEHSADTERIRQLEGRLSRLETLVQRIETSVERRETLLHTNAAVNPREGLSR